MRCRCPYCANRFWQTRNTEGAQFCRRCHQLFVAPPEEKTPSWVLGVVVILMANWQIISHHPPALAAVSIERRSPDMPQGQTPLCSENSQVC